ALRRAGLLSEGIETRSAPAVLDPQRIRRVSIASGPGVVATALERLRTSLDHIHEVVADGQRPIEIADRLPQVAEQRACHTTGIEGLRLLRHRGHQVLGILKRSYRIAACGPGQRA